MTQIVLLIGRQAIRQSLLAGLTGLAVGSLLGCALILWTGNLAPVVLHEAWQLDGTAPRDRRLEPHIDLDRNRDRSIETTRRLWTWVDCDGRSIEQLYQLFRSTIHESGDIPVRITGEVP